MGALMEGCAARHRVKLLLICEIFLFIHNDLIIADQTQSRVINTKYGKVQGFIRQMSRPSLLPVEVYLGVPYASSPVGEGRFTPTSSTLPWDHIMKCDKLPPVCPQPLIGGDSGFKIRSMPKELEDYYLSFRPILENQNEDCLYLNIYAPHDGGGNYPVMVYIHGDSFSWGSGNMYDGTILASYGQTIVVTVNYRLGPLGFLNVSPGGNQMGVVSNQGLMDQLAALSWIQENIASFGGDKAKVTLMGHSTGAACISYLIASPVLLPDLFQRAILMSGSAFSPWAEVTDALSVTVRLAKLLNCSVPSDLSRKHPETVACLRNVSASALVNAPMPQYKFASVFGPSVDGVVITEDYKDRYKDVLKERKISLMFGVTEGDAFLELSSNQAAEGLKLAERNKIFKTFVRNTYKHHLQEIYLAITKEYTDWGNPTPNPIKTRDLTIEALSDGGYLSPLINFAEVVSLTSDIFMYVFAHHEREHQEGLGSVYRSEIPLLFGRPFQDHFSSIALDYSSYHTSYSSSSSPSGAYHPSPIGSSASNFSRADALVSEYLMRCWTNFAKSGNPNFPEDTRPMLALRERSKHKNLTWESFTRDLEKYLEISSRPRLKGHYRAHKVALWNWLLPELEAAGSKYPQTESELWHTSEDGKYFIGPVRPLDPFRFLKPTTVPKLPSVIPPASPVDGYLTPNVSAAQGSLNREFNISNQEPVVGIGSLLDYTTALTLTVAIGLSLLVLNVILFAALLYKRDRGSMSTKMKYDSVSVQPLCIVDSAIRSNPVTHENINPNLKDIPVSCSQPDPQCTELHTFPTPPDIGDRNTEVTFHNSSSVHSMLSQPTSQFIPPPPLLSTTPPSPPMGNITSEGVDGGACGQSRCFPDVSADAFQNGMNHYNEDSPGQYPPDVAGLQFSSVLPPATYSPEGSSRRYNDHNLKQYGKECPDNSKCTASSSCSYTTTSSHCPSGQYCPTQYSTSINQYPPTSEPYPDIPSQYSSSPCQFSDSGQDPSRFLPDSRTGSPSGNLKPARSARTATLSRQVSTGSGNCNVRKPQPPPRGAVMPSYATLPRQNSKEGEITQ